LGKDHCNYMGTGEVIGPVVASIKYVQEINSYRVVLRTKNGNRKHLVAASGFHFPATEWKPNCYELLLNLENQLKDVEMCIVDRPGLQQGFLEYESKDMRVTNKFKFGIVLCKKKPITRRRYV